MLPALKNNAAAGYQGPGEIELLKGADVLVLDSHLLQNSLTKGINGNKQYIPIYRVTQSFDSSLPDCIRI